MARFSICKCDPNQRTTELDCIVGCRNHSKIQEKTKMNTVWQIVDLESDKVFFTSRESQAERWNNDEQFDVTVALSRRPVDGYTTWVLNSNTDKHSLKLGMETFVGVMGILLEYEAAASSAICPHCETRWTYRDGKWNAVIKRHGSHCQCPANWKCTICNMQILNPIDFAEYTKNGAHVACAEKELAGTEHFPPCDYCEHFHEMNQTCGKCGKTWSGDDPVVIQDDGSGNQVLASGKVLYA